MFNHREHTGCTEIIQQEISTDFYYLTLSIPYRMRKLVYLFLFISVHSFAQTKALVGGTLIDGFGGKPLQNSVVIIEGERIKAIGTVGNIEIPKGAEIISTEGMSVMPGLWDMHVHLMINGHSDYTHWDIWQWQVIFGKDVTP